MKGIKVHFNRFNKPKCSDEKCCCEKGYYTKFAASTLFCFICNLVCARRITNTSSFCKKFGWDKKCQTCNQRGDFCFRGDEIERTNY